MLEFFDVVGSFGSHILDLLLTLEENSCFVLFIGVNSHTSSPCVRLPIPWMSKTVRIVIIPTVGVIQSQLFLSLLDLLSTSGDRDVWCLTDPYHTFVSTFHTYGPAARPLEMRSAAEGRLKEKNKLGAVMWERKPTLSLILGYKWRVSIHVFTKNTTLKSPVVRGVVKRQSYH